MDLVVIVIAIVSALAAIAAAIAAGIQARASVRAADHAEKSREASETARAEAVALNRQANELLERQARAQEEVAALARAQAPRDELEWTMRPGHNDIVEIVNTGNITVYNVTAEGGAGVHIDEDSRADVLPPGDYIEVGVMPASFNVSKRTVTLSWQYTPDGDVHTETARVRPNR